MKTIYDHIHDEAFNMGFELTAAQKDELCKASPGLVREFRQFGNDTASRDRLAQDLAKHFIGCTWPLGHEGAKAWDRFCRKVIKAALAGKCDIRTACFKPR